jgi:hypothetical protein
MTSSAAAQERETAIQSQGLHLSVGAHDRIIFV